MRKETINIYTIEELKQVNPDGYRKAIKEVSDRRAGIFMDHEVREIITTLERAAATFTMDVVNYSIGLYANNYFRINTDYYEELDENEKAACVAWLNNHLDEGIKGSCPFTGVMWDCYFFDGVQDYKEGYGKSVTTDNLPRAVLHAIDFTINKAIDQQEDLLENDQDMEEEADNGEYEFLEDGTIHY